VLEANKVGKLRDHGYMVLGYSRFVNDVNVKKGGFPNQGRHRLFFQVKKKSIKDDEEKLCV
jgi:hypothetical protein